MVEVGAAWQNGYAERLMRTIIEEEVELSEYTTYADAMKQLGRFLDQVYMHKHIHSVLSYLTPAGFESQWKEEQSASVRSSRAVTHVVSNLMGQYHRIVTFFLRKYNCRLFFRYFLNEF